MNIVLFEDQLTERLHPVTTGRPSYAITIGSFRLIDWVRQFEGHLVGWVRPYLLDLQSAEFPDVDSQLDSRQDWTLLINARTIPSQDSFTTLQQLFQRQAPAVIRTEDEIQAALVPTNHLTSRVAQFPVDLERTLATVDPKAQKLNLSLNTYQHGHELVQYQLKIIQQNLEFRIQQGGYQQLQDGLFVAAGVKLPEFFVANTDDGPILIDQNAKIGPYTFMSGPIYIGPNSKVIEHASIKDAVSLGHTTKVGGEVEASIIEPYTNKQHHGFLGHSYVGSWVNLGAGTCNSDLKNTYGEVKMEYAYGKVNTGSQFVGCLIGDYAKSAINTSIFTGKIIGTCSMIYGFVTTNVPSFVNYARHFGQVTEMAPSVMVATQQRMFARRKVEQRDCDIQLIHDMYDLTRRERQLSEEPLSL